MKSAQISIERVGHRNGGVWNKAKTSETRTDGVGTPGLISGSSGRARHNSLQALLAKRQLCARHCGHWEGNRYPRSRHCLVLEDSHEGVQGQHATLGPYCGSDGVKGVCLLLHYIESETDFTAVV